ncbi:uncharacterized protein LOC142063215 [Phalacrocorax aristotelis]|uniref:uncharacterized protein LOC142063215 n=1 Tax=Phalacrocorax aristotelis TaxID=126867 RepID=UPI003F4C205E
MGKTAQSQSSRDPITRDPKARPLELSGTAEQGYGRKALAGLAITLATTDAPNQLTPHLRGPAPPRRAAPRFLSYPGSAPRPQPRSTTGVEPTVPLVWQPPLPSLPCGRRPGGQRAASGLRLLGPAAGAAARPSEGQPEPGDFPKKLNEKMKTTCFRNGWLVTLLLALDNMVLSLAFNPVCALQVGPKSGSLRYFNVCLSVSLEDNIQISLE